MQRRKIHILCARHASRGLRSLHRNLTATPTAHGENQPGTEKRLPSPTTVAAYHSISYGVRIRPPNQVGPAYRGRLFG
jgi:hypothetical protein